MRRECELSSRDPDEARAGLMLCYLCYLALIRTAACVWHSAEKHWLAWAGSRLVVSIPNGVPPSIICTINQNSEMRIALAPSAQLILVGFYQPVMIPFSLQHLHLDQIQYNCIQLAPTHRSSIILQRDASRSPRVASFNHRSRRHRSRRRRQDRRHLPCVRRSAFT